MTREELVRLYNKLTWYFCNGVYPTVKTKNSDSCEQLYTELTELQKTTPELKNTRVKEKATNPLKNTDE